MTTFTAKGCGGLGINDTAVGDRTSVYFEKFAFTSQVPQTFLILIDL
jgi:hypothetical protein